MSTFSALKRAKRLGIDKLTEQQAKDGCAEYVNDIAAQDDRRLMWLVERAANHTAEMMEEKETEIIVAERFNDTEALDAANRYLKMYTEDFVFLHSLHTLLKNRVIENSSKGLAEFFKQKKHK